MESLNPSRDLEFGYEIDEEARKLRRPSGPTTTSLGRSRNHFGKHQPSALAKADPTSESGTPEWRWWGADWHSIGYVANTIQLFGATIFWVSTLCGLPGILPESGVYHLLFAHRSYDSQMLQARVWLLDCLRRALPCGRYSTGYRKLSAHHVLSSRAPSSCWNVLRSGTSQRSRL